LSMCSSSIIEAAIEHKGCECSLALDRLHE
jgi:hypothetical protein